jgi:hypothetical protein
MLDGLSASEEGHLSLVTVLAARSKVSSLQLTRCDYPDIRTIEWMSRTEGSKNLAEA